MVCPIHTCEHHSNRTSEVGPYTHTMSEYRYDHGINRLCVPIHDVLPHRLHLIQTGLVQGFQHLSQDRNDGGVQCRLATKGPNPTTRRNSNDTKRISIEAQIGEIAISIGEQ